MENDFHTVFMSPKVDYVLITSLFVCKILPSRICGDTAPLRLEHVTELFGEPQKGGMYMSRINVTDLTFSYDGSFDAEIGRAHV